MNTSVLKNFAPAVRRKLMEAVTRKLDFVLSAQTPDYLTTYARQVTSLRDLSQQDRPGLVERVAYTWFNRFTALRYLDAKGWHPFRARVLTPTSSEETQPEILKVTRNGALPEELRRHTDPSRLDHLLDGRIPSVDRQGEVYRQLVLSACRFYHELLPDLFERLDDETELLLPDDLLSKQSVAYGFRTEITDVDCAEVEILGWLYQFYISEKKDVVMARKKAVPTEDIPAVTQLFTPHWIVRYLVENSLGRLWLLNRPESRLRKQMTYYIEGETENNFPRIIRPEDIRLLDPAVGSGHMLTYAFDLLVAIYEEEGYPPSDIPALILTHNLHGIDICPRAAQIAALALVLKARETSRQFFQADRWVQPNILALQDVRFEQGELGDYIRILRLGDLIDKQTLGLFAQFENARALGSLIHPNTTRSPITVIRRALETTVPVEDLFFSEVHAKVLQVLQYAEYLSHSYNVVVTNPPYMGGRQMNADVKAFARANFPDSCTDLFAAFIERCSALVSPRGYCAMVTMQNWMFLSSFEAMRKRLLRERNIVNMAHIGARGFETLGGEVVQTTAFVIHNDFSASHKGCFLRLTNLPSESSKCLAAQESIRNSNSDYFYRASADDFNSIPGSPIAYWLTDSDRDAFRNPSLDTIASVCIGMKTGDNPFFLRFWYEVSYSDIAFHLTSLELANQSGFTWFPYLKGGDYRKWHGNYDLVLRWVDSGNELLNHLNRQGISDARIRPSNFDKYFKTGINWSFIASGSFAVRIQDAGFFFDVAGSSVFPTDDADLHRLAGFLNSTVANRCLAAINPTLNAQIENVKCLPIAPLGSAKSTVNALVSELKSISKADWDSFETSWDFPRMPLLEPEMRADAIESTWLKWNLHCDSVIRRVRELETNNNRLFITAYHLQDVLEEDIPEAQITVRRADKRNDMIALLSYAVGCMMGRYSLGSPGLIIADAGRGLEEYSTKVGKETDELIFTVCEHGIIPVLDGEWFEDDIVGRTREFLRATFGEATLRENVRFIEKSLGKDLRKYFLVDFYKDHLQTYKKRPIYWMVQSPRKGFSVLIYLHRYTRDTMNIVLNHYLREYQEKLRNRLAHLTQIQGSEAISTRDKIAARKEADKLTKTLHECEEWERETVLPLAQARIDLDLDDGVKANYFKLGEALAPIPGFAAEDE